jgi:hypothetical protein
MNMAGSDEAKQDHPAEKPVLLYEVPIRNHLKPGEVAYDPFVGSGDLHRRGGDARQPLLPAEVDPKYVQLSIERWQRLTGWRRSGSVAERPVRRPSFGVARLPVRPWRLTPHTVTHPHRRLDRVERGVEDLDDVALDLVRIDFLSKAASQLIGDVSGRADGH